MTNTATTSRITVGYADHRLVLGHNAGQPVGYDLYRDGRIRSGAIIGRSMTGKTSLLAGITDAVASTGHTRVWIGDAHDKTDHQLTLDVPYRATGLDKVREMLRLAARAVIDRQPSADFTPSRKRPGVLVLVDDAKQLLSDAEIATLVRSIADNGGSSGIGVLTVTSSDDPHSLGGADVRHALLRHHAIVLGNIDDHFRTMPLPHPNPHGPADGHLISAATQTASPFTFDWSTSV